MTSLFRKLVTHSLNFFENISSISWRGGEGHWYLILWELIASSFKVGVDSLIFASEQVRPSAVSMLILTKTKIFNLEKIVSARNWALINLVEMYWAAMMKCVNSRLSEHVTPAFVGSEGLYRGCFNILHLHCKESRFIPGLSEHVTPVL